MKHEWIYALLLIPIVGSFFFDPIGILIAAVVTIGACFIAAGAYAWLRKR